MVRHLFTVQSKEVIKILLRDQIYYPHLEKSKGYDEMALTYPALLDSFNRLNDASFNGMIFAFSNESGQDSFEIVNDLYSYLLKNLNVSEAFNFWKSEYVILKFQTDEKINLMPVDFNDVIKLSIGKTKDIQQINALYNSIQDFNLDIWSIITYMNEGKENPNTKLKSFIEVHYPYLKIENINGVYANFDFEASKKNGSIKVFDLFEEAEDLKKLIDS